MLNNHQLKQFYYYFFQFYCHLHQKILIFVFFHQLTLVYFSKKLTLYNLDDTMLIIQMNPFHSLYFQVTLLQVLYLINHHYFR